MHDFFNWKLLWSHREKKNTIKKSTWIQFIVNSVVISSCDCWDTLKYNTFYSHKQNKHFSSSIHAKSFQIPHSNWINRNVIVIEKINDLNHFIIEHFQDSFNFTELLKRPKNNGYTDIFLMFKYKCATRLTEFAKKKLERDFESLHSLSVFPSLPMNLWRFGNNTQNEID